MTNDKFNKILTDTITKIKSLQFAKGKEYSLDNDRLSAFKSAASITNKPVHQVLEGMMVKHTVSIYDMLNKPSTIVFSPSKWDEKIMDNIIYLILLQAIVYENELHAEFDES